MNLNGEIDWSDTDRIVSNDTRYVSLDGDWWRESSTWQTRRNGSSELTLMGCSRTRLMGLGKNGEAVSSPLVQSGISNFQPQYDADGNQTLVKTATGIWQVEYNGENRPVRWTQGDMVITMSFDRMGRRVTKNDQRFVYNGYLQICNYNSSTSTSHFNYHIWDPTEPVATRPLAWTTRTTNHQSPTISFYTYDGNKNVSEVITIDDSLVAHYEYAPFGALTVSRGVSAAANPWRFSSEYAEDDTATVYYNYRHYESVTGRWMSRDPMPNDRGILYAYVDNNAIGYFDNLGLLKACPKGSKVKKEGSSCKYRTNRDKGGDKKSNGCGADGGVKVPDSFFWMVGFEGCCNAHDVCYGTCGRTKYKCDLGLGACMSSRCMSKLWWSPFLLSLCVNQAEIYAVAVLGFGGDPFDAAQDENCEWEGCCCDK